MNTVNLIGRLTKDTELRYTTGGEPLAICVFSIAVQRQRNRDVVDFFDCQSWGKTAETIHKYFEKGRQIAVSGEIHQERWKNSNGENRSKHVINVNSFDFLGNKSEHTAEQNEEKITPPDGFEEISELDIPF